MHTSQILIALGILAIVASLMVCMVFDLERLRREVELDELWRDEVGAADPASRASSGGGADNIFGGAA